MEHDRYDNKEIVCQLNRQTNESKTISRLSKEAMSLGLSHLAEKLGIDKLSSAAEGIVSKYCRN